MGEVLEALELRDVVGLQEQHLEAPHGQRAQRRQRVDVVEPELQHFQRRERVQPHGRAVRQRARVAAGAGDEGFDAVVVEAQDGERREVGDGGEVGDEVVVEVEDPEIGEAFACGGVGSVSVVGSGLGRQRACAAIVAARVRAHLHRFILFFYREKIHE